MSIPVVDIRYDSEGLHVVVETDGKQWLAKLHVSKDLPVGGGWYPPMYGLVVDLQNKKEFK